MTKEGRRATLRSLVIGGLVGGAAGLAAGKLRAKRSRALPIGLAAFEQAPCFRELLEDQPDHVTARGTQTPRASGR